MANNLKEYIVIVKNFDDINSLYEDMESIGGDLYIPHRRVEIAELRPMSNSTHFMLTDEEAEQIKKDPRVLDVTLPYWALGVKAESTGSVGQFQENWNKSWNSTSDDKNWGLYRCFNGTTQANWGIGRKENLSGAIGLKYTGQNVDVVICDGHILADHPEFAVNADGTGGSRVKYYNWLQHNKAVLGPNAPDGTYVNEITESSDHGTHVAATVAGNTQGWARSANIYSINFAQTTSTNSIGNWAYVVIDYVRQFHQSKPINPATGRKNPTIVNNSWCLFYPEVYPDKISSVIYQGQTYTNRNWLNERSNFKILLNDRLNGTTIETTGKWRIGYRDSSLDNSITNSTKEGIIQVAAASNFSGINAIFGSLDYDNAVIPSEGKNSGKNVYYMRGPSPGCADDVLCVGSVDVAVEERKAEYSNNGPRIDVFAPGTAIISGVTGRWHKDSIVPDPRDGSYYLMKMQGTSMASPQVTGILACALELWPLLTQSEVMNKVKGPWSANQMVDSSDYYYGLSGATQRYIKLPDELKDSAAAEKAEKDEVDKLKGIDYSAWGSKTFDIDGTWTPPKGVSNVSVVCIGAGAAGASEGGGGGGGLGWKNDIPVTEGQSYTVKVGKAVINSTTDGDSYFISKSTVAGLAGKRASGEKRNYTQPGARGSASGWSESTFTVFKGGEGGSFAGGGGGKGGDGGWAVSGGPIPAGGGGAGGYESDSKGNSGGEGGNGSGTYSGAGSVTYYWSDGRVDRVIQKDGKTAKVEATVTNSAGAAGYGGGGAGGSFSGPVTRLVGYAGGGVGLNGKGNSGKNSGEAGSGGSQEIFGGGGSLNVNKTVNGISVPKVGGGAVRIVWPGNVRKFPTANVGLEPGVKITSNVSAVNEGSSVSFVVTATSFNDGDYIFWRTTDGGSTLSSVEFTDGKNTGYKKIVSGSATIVRTVSNNYRKDGARTITFEVSSFGITGPAMASSKVIINDTSLPEVIITTDKGPVINEGDEIIFTLKPRGVNTGSLLYWENIGDTIVTDFEVYPDQTLQSQPTVNLTFKLKNDYTTEKTVPETIQIQVKDTNSKGDILGKSQIISVTDSSKTLVQNITITATPTSVTETNNNIITLTVNYQNIPIDTKIYLVPVTGVGTAGYEDFDSVNPFAKGSPFTFSATTPGYNQNLNNTCTGSFSLTISVTADLKTEGAEKLTFKVVKDNITTGQLLATSPTITITDSSITPPPTYSIFTTPNTITINEGGTVTYGISTSNVPDGTTLYWTNKGTSAADFTDGRNSGFIIINSTNPPTISRTLLADNLTDPNETIILELRTGSITGPVVATASKVDVNDTSTAPPTYRLTSNVTVVNEGDSVLYTLVTTGIADGTTLFWENIGKTTPDDFTDSKNSDSITITVPANSLNGSANFIRTLASDRVTEISPETMELVIKSSLGTGAITLTKSLPVTVNDTSNQIPKTYSIISATGVTQVNEGGSINFSIRVSNVSAGTTLYWTTSGTCTADDFIDNITQGVLPVGSAGTSQLTRSLKADKKVDGDENFIIELRTDGYAGPIVARSPSITVKDTSTK